MFQYQQHVKDFLKNLAPLCHLCQRKHVEDFSGLEKNYMVLLLESFFHRQRVESNDFAKCNSVVHTEG